MGRDQPPWLAVLFLRLCMGRRSYEAIMGDLLEEYATGKHSTWWLWREALSAVPWNLRRKPERFEASNMRLHLLDTVTADIRYGMRTLLKTPGLAGAILIATALGIGVNTGIFSLLNALVLRPL